MALLFNTPLFLHLVVILLNYHVQKCRSVPMELLQARKKIISGTTFSSTIKKPQVTTSFALHQEDDLDEEYVLIEKVNSKNIQPLIATQSAKNQYFPNQNQANKLQNHKIELLDDYIHIDRPYIKGSNSQIDDKYKPKQLKKGQSTMQNAAVESNPENRSKDKIKVEEKVQEERHESLATQKTTAEDMKPKPVNEGSDTMWFWNEDKELGKRVSSMPELKDQIESLLNSNKENSIETLKTLGKKIKKEKTEETRLIIAFISSLLKISKDKGRLEHIQDLLEKILGDYQKFDEAGSKLSKKEETIDRPMKILGISFGKNLNRLPPDHKFNRKIYKGSAVKW